MQLLDKSLVAVMRHQIAFLKHTVFLSRKPIGNLFNLLRLRSGVDMTGFVLNLVLLQCHPFIRQAMMALDERIVMRKSEL